MWVCAIAEADFRFDVWVCTQDVMSGRLQYLDQHMSRLSMTWVFTGTRVGHHSTGDSLAGADR